MPPWVLVDVSYLCHRAKHTMKGLSFEDEPTGIIYGFFEALRDVCFDKRIASNRVIACFDSRQSFRKDADPTYKAKRWEDLTPEEWAEIKVMKKQVKLLRREILPLIGFSVLKQQGLESDDLMAQAALQVAERNERAVIITADGDLYQCISPSVDWYDPARDKYFDEAAFVFDKGVTPKQWGEMKCLAGCHGDNVKGVPGVAEKTALDYMKGSLPKHHQRYKAIDCQAGRDTIIRNREFVILPHPQTQPIKLTAPHYNADAFFRICSRFGIKSYLTERRHAWENFFQGKMTESRQEPRKRGQLV